ncbi:heme biosynthesis protein HemY [Ideonella livida]|uniref:Heme biosynthesis protein HemY n=1 Tax=Ideonella livida TaxID=2707176 RepID=A0A7C9PH47_9BURK|nr:heme biosynthesis HemY N-terminal domain-containing protein [Ideonella livida]NDY91549.1 heme biosynthesis protein HemY [Ideonella livida]
MRNIAWMLLVFVAAVVAATFLGSNDALVSLYYGHWRLDLSLNLFLLVVAAAVVAAFLVLRTADSLWSLPGRARAWRELKRERAAQAALREAMTEALAARYARAQRAAERALALQADTAALREDTGFSVLAHGLLASAAHRLQDRKGRDEAVQTALSLARSQQLSGSAVDGLLLQCAEWAVEDRQAEEAQRLLAELPPGVARRTQALRLRLQLARQMRQPLQALQVARLLAKHQGFSAAAAQSLLRSLALDALDQAFDVDQLQRTWQQLDAADRQDPWVVARAASRAARLGEAGTGRFWLQQAWERLGKFEPEGRAALALALVDCAPGAGSEWLPRLEVAMGQHGHEPALVAAAAMVFADRQLWGKARRLLEQTASAVALPSSVRRQSLRCLAGMAREEGQEDRALAYDQRAAAID